MKVLLVNPSRPVRDTYIMPPLHLLYISQAIKKCGHESEIVDIPYLINTNPRLYKNNEKSCIDLVMSKKFDILGVGSVVSSYPFCERLVKSIKEKNNDLPVIVGGSVGLPVKQLWEQNAKPDYICESDGELVIENFLRYYPGSLDDVKRIPGLHYFNGEKYIANKPELPLNLDYIPFLDYDEIDTEYYIGELGRMLGSMITDKNNRFRRNERFLPIIFSRGCVYKCTFCFHFNNLHRKHSAGYIADYMEHLKSKYNLTAFSIIDDLTILDKKWLSTVLDAIISKNMDVNLFSGGGKPSVVDREILLKFKAAGLKRLSYGIESGSQTILDVMNKGVTVEDNYNAVKLMREVGIPCSTNIVFGMPQENRKTMNETANFLASLDLSSADYYTSMAVPYPGAPLFDYCIAKGLIKDTREYLFNIGGYADYKINLTDMKKAFFLANVKAVAYIVDVKYSLKRKRYFISVFLAALMVLHVFYFIVLPADLRMKINLANNITKFKKRFRWKNRT